MNGLQTLLGAEGEVPLPYESNDTSYLGRLPAELREEALKYLLIPQFETALKDGDLKKIQEILARGVKPNDILPSGKTPLGIIASSKEPWPKINNSIDLLVQHGADLNGKDKFGLTPLMNALKDATRFKDSIKAFVDRKKQGLRINEKTIINGVEQTALDFVELNVSEPAQNYIAGYLKENGAKHAAEL